MRRTTRTLVCPLAAVLSFATGTLQAEARSKPVVSKTLVSWPLGPRAVIPPPSAQRLQADLGPLIRRWQESEKLLGERKRQHLWIARFHLANERAGVWRDENPQAVEETEAIARSVTLKLLREHLERSPPIEGLLQRLESGGQSLKERGSDWRLRVSPRVDLGREPFLGANLSLRQRPVLSRFVTGFRQHLGQDASTLFLQYEDDRLHVRLQYETTRDDNNLATLRLRWLF